MTTTFKDKALNEDLRRQGFLTRFLGDFGPPPRSRCSPPRFDSRLPILSKDEKDRERKKEGVDPFREKFIPH